MLNDKYTFPDEDELKHMTLEERLAEFDRLCLSDDEKRAIDDLNQKTKEQQEYSDKASDGVMWGAFTAGIGAIMGSPFGAVRGTMAIQNNLQKFNAAANEMNNINKEREDIRKKAQDRFEQAMNMGTKINYDGSIEDDCEITMLGRRRVWL